MEQSKKAAVLPKNASAPLATPANITSELPGYQIRCTVKKFDSRLSWRRSPIVTHDSWTTYRHTQLICFYILWKQ